MDLRSPAPYPAAPRRRTKIAGAPQIRDSSIQSRVRSVRLRLPALPLFKGNHYTQDKNHRSRPCRPRQTPGSCGTRRRATVAGQIPYHPGFPCGSRHGLLPAPSAVRLHGAGFESSRGRRLSGG
jgi:hypothetical protein